MKKLGCLAFAAVLGLMVVGCASTNSKENKAIELKNKEVNFNSEKGSLFVSNNTAEDVVVFVGKVEKGNLIGGIHANSSRSFDISKIPGIPSSGSLLIRVATANVYKEKARITEEDVIYTGLVVYDLNDLGDKISLSIYRGVDASQKECIYVSNESENFVLELRLGNPSQGEVIATLAPLTTNKRIYLSSRDDSLSYDFYPTFIYVNPKTNEKTSMNNPGRADRKRAYPEPIGGDITPMRFEGPSASSVGYDVAFVSIQNDTNSGIEFRNAETPLKNQKGRRFTASGRSDVYEIESKNGEAGKLYTSLTFEFDNFTKKKISPFTFLPGYKYDVIVTELDGNYQYDIREVGKKSLVEDARIQLFME
ncbi:hypothetical protein [uncultured Treponema sp.]|uniref:hypothetical protein n=1 Tax=uncultured Treponema sp. TaxID=162155 RepID=UPI00258E4C88|nr:hypothetical protein [uncultured Treponema sp.]